MHTCEALHEHTLFTILHTHSHYTQLKLPIRVHPAHCSACNYSNVCDTCGPYPTIQSTMKQVFRQFRHAYRSHSDVHNLAIFVPMTDDRENRSLCPFLCMHIPGNNDHAWNTGQYWYMHTSCILCGYTCTCMYMLAGFLSLLRVTS